MSRESIVLTPDQGLVDPAYDKYLDSPPTRRELQKVFNKIGVNQTQFWEGLDTQALVGNFLCEKLGVTRGEIDAYVARKAAEVAEVQKKAAEATQSAPEASDAQSNV